MPIPLAKFDHRTYTSRRLVFWESLVDPWETETVGGDSGGESPPTPGQTGE
jgi:hypothetical protein